MIAFTRSKVSTIQEHNDKVISNEETDTMGCEIGKCNKKVVKKVVNLRKVGHQLKKLGGGMKLFKK